MATGDVSTARSDRIRRRLLFKRFARDTKGATAIEFAMLAVPFLITLFAILEFGLALTVQQLVVNATDDVAREVRTGQVKALTTAELKTKICDRIDFLVTANCPGLKVDLRTYPSFQAASNQQVFQTSNEGIALEFQAGKALALKSEIGGSGARQTLRSFYFWPITVSLLYPSMAKAGNGKMLISASQTWQNERY